MKYIKYTFIIMMMAAILSFSKIDALGIGQITIDVLGTKETTAHQKKSSSPQYARKTSCHGTLTGSDLSTAARTHLDSAPYKYGDWIALTTSDRELTGDYSYIDSAYYKLNFKVTNSVENCYFVGSWTIN